MVISQRVRLLAPPSEALVASLVGVPPSPACGVLGLGLVSRFPGGCGARAFGLGARLGAAAFCLGAPWVSCLFPPSVLSLDKGLCQQKPIDYLQKSLCYRNGLYRDKPTLTRWLIFKWHPPATPSTT